ncbi:MAG: phosphonate C-P lyase system protein PhnG [Rhodopila sp.]
MGRRVIRHRHICFTLSAHCRWENTVDDKRVRAYLSRHLHSDRFVMTDEIANLAPARRRWMAVLARAKAKQIEAYLAACGRVPKHTIIRGPEGGLVMVRGRIGGGGGPFNLGEMTVTRCTVRIASGSVGHAYVAGRDERQAELAAVADALMQDPDWTDMVNRCVIVPLEQAQAAARAERAAKAAGTRVQFFAMQTTRA